MRTPNIISWAIAGSLLSIAPCAMAADGEVELKVGTLAPRGSTWEKVFKYINDDLIKATQGRMKIKLYPGGVQGDEKVMIEKMKVGQLQSAGITATGMALIVPEALIFQLPRLFKTYEELDYVRNALNPDMEKLFLAKGFVLGGWSDQGFVHFYSKNPIRVPGDLAKGKMWTWNIDPMFVEVATVAGASPVPLGVPDVLPALNTGLVDIVYGAPLATLSLQWWDKVKYVTSMPIQNGVGAIVTTKEADSKLSDADKKAYYETSSKWLDKLLGNVRKANEKSAEALRQNGIQTVELTPADEKAWEDVADKVSVAMTGKLYPRELLDKIHSLLKEFRAKKK